MNDKLQQAAQCTLDALEPGTLFQFRDSIALKTEYRTNGGTVQSYLLGSGEMFWGGTNTPEELNKLMVTPISPEAKEYWAEQDGGIEFAKWLEENTEVIREPKITLYRYCDAEGCGNYILDDIYKVFMDKRETPMMPAKEYWREQEEEIDSAIEKHLNRIREKTIESLIELHIGKMDALEKFSVRHFLETGTINGSFFNRLRELLIAYRNFKISTPANSTNQIK